MKRCARCRQEQPRTAFRFLVSRGLDPWCRDCRNAYMAAYRLRNKVIRNLERIGL